MHIKYSLKRAAGLLLFLAGFFIIRKGLYYVLVNDTKNYTRLTLHELYQQGNIDALFVGSSHCYHSIDTAVLDRELGLNTFNAGTSSQNLDGSWTMIQEAVRVNHVKHIYLEMFYYIGGCPLPKQRTSMTETYIISDFMKPGFLKFEYLLKASNTQHYVNSFFPMRRNKEGLYDLNRMLNITKAKNQESYREFQTNTDYKGKGYVPYPKEIDGYNYFYNKKSNVLREDVTDVDRYHAWWEYLSKIIAFCKKEQIELTLFSTPMPEYLLARFDYDNYINMLQSYLEGTGISYWDFNLCKEAYLPADSSLYTDFHHLSQKGAEMFSTLLARYIQGEISSEELFYNSYKERLQHLDPNIFGITFLVVNGEGGTTFRSCSIVSAPTEGMEYQITIRPAEGDAYLVQDYNRNTVFPLTENGAGKILIKWRVKGHPEFTGERIIDFPEK